MLTCKLKQTGKILLADDYNPKIHKGNIIDPFTDAPVFYRKDHFRVGYKIRPHFVSTYSGDFPKHIIFDREYFENEKIYKPCESPEHIQGKLTIAEFCKNQLNDGLKPEAIKLEYPIKMDDGRYRIADVAVVLPDGDVCVHEVQLASITPEELSDRTNDYRSQGIDVIWWLGKAALTNPNKTWIAENLQSNIPVLKFEEEFES